MRERHDRRVVRLQIRFVETEKIFRQWTEIRRPLAEVKISPRLSHRPHVLQLRIKDAVVPREKWDHPELFKPHRARAHLELRAEFENALQLLDRIVLRIAHP